MNEISGDELAAVVAALRKIVHVPALPAPSAWKLAARTEAVDAVLPRAQRDIP